MTTNVKLSQEGDGGGVGKLVKTSQIIICSGADTINISGLLKPKKLGNFNYWMLKKNLVV